MRAASRLRHHQTASVLVSKPVQGWFIWFHRNPGWCLEVLVLRVAFEILDVLNMVADLV